MGVMTESKNHYIDLGYGRPMPALKSQKLALSDILNTQKSMDGMRLYDEDERAFYESYNAKLKNWTKIQRQDV